MAFQVVTDPAGIWRILNSEDVRWRLSGVTADPVRFAADPANLFVQDGDAVAIFSRERFPVSPPGASLFDGVDDFWHLIPPFRDIAFLREVLGYLFTDLGSSFVVFDAGANLGITVGAEPILQLPVTKWRLSRAQWQAAAAAQAPPSRQPPA